MKAVQRGKYFKHLIEEIDFLHSFPTYNFTNIKYLQRSQTVKKLNKILYKNWLEHYLCSALAEWNNDYNSNNTLIWRKYASYQ